MLPPVHLANGLLNGCFYQGICSSRRYTTVRRTGSVPGKLISTYVVGYKLKGRGSLQDMIGYESQIVELFNNEQFPWFTTERLKKLGVYEKYLEIKKKQEGLT